MYFDFQQKLRKWEEEYVENQCFTALSKHFFFYSADISSSL